jgi:hypothetical protein
MTQQVELRESNTSVPSAVDKAKGIWRIQLIEADVQGSSGYYPAEVLERDGAKAFPKGTHIYLDHPTWREEEELPERSVDRLAAVQLEDAYFADGKDGHGLFARVSVRPDQRERFEWWTENAAVGMSIRALGVKEFNEATAREEVTELVRGQSVDVVTRAGAGGRLIEMTESARQSAGATSIFSESDKSLLQQLVQTNKELVDSNKSLAKRVSELEEKAGTKERPKSDEVVGLTNGQLFAKLNDAGLPSMLATQIADGYTAGADVDAQIEQAKALTDEIAKGLAPTETTETTEPVAAEKVEESDRGIGYVSESAAPTETFGTVLTGFFNQAG